MILWFCFLSGQSTLVFLFLTEEELVLFNTNFGQCLPHASANLKSEIMPYFKDILQLQSDFSVRVRFVAFCFWWTQSLALGGVQVYLLLLKGLDMGHKVQEMGHVVGLSCFTSFVTWSVFELEFQEMNAYSCHFISIRCCDELENYTSRVHENSEHLLQY